MSGALAVPNQFQNAVTATGLQLDNNFSTVTSYINDPTNRNNYIADSSGATNTVNLTFIPAVVGGYTTGLDLTWKWANTNTGSTVVNANGLGQSNLVNPDGSALVGGQGLAGSIGHGAYDGTRFIYLTPPSPASKAAMQTATASASFVSPSQVQNAQAAAKAWTVFNGTNTGTILALASYGISQIVRTGTGSYSIALSNAFASSNYVAVSMSRSGQSMGEDTALPRSTAGINLVNVSGGVPTDTTIVHFICFGTIA